jgi:hypothetical protein
VWVSSRPIHPGERTWLIDRADNVIQIRVGRAGSEDLGGRGRVAYVYGAVPCMHHACAPRESVSIDRRGAYAMDQIYLYLQARQVLPGVLLA